MLCSIESNLKDHIVWLISYSSLIGTSTNLAVRGLNNVISVYVKYVVFHDHFMILSYQPTNVHLYVYNYSFVM